MQKDAFLIFKGLLYRPSSPFLLENAFSPVTALIEGIWNQFPDQALFMLRERILTNYALTPLCEGMIKVSAKRASQVSEEEFYKTISSHSNIWVTVSPRLIDFEFKNNLSQPLSKQEKINLLLKLKSKSTHSLNRYESDRAVGAILLDKNDNLLGQAWNTNGKNRTQHAELNLIRSFQYHHKTKIPVGSKIWITLKPCAMCAAQIFSASENPETIEVNYLEDDPGPFSKNSVLVQNSDLWVKAGKPKIKIFSSIS